MYAHCCTHVFVMMIFRPSPGRKRLTCREKIACLLGHADLLTFEDETCRGAAGDRELPIDQLGRARDRLRSDPYQVWLGYERAVDWVSRGKNDRDKVIRVVLITPRFILKRDAELAKHCFVDRQRINYLRQELWAVLARVKDDVSL